MRLVIVACAALTVMTAPALAYENFIPLGHAYSPEDAELPPINSDQERIISQTDVYEAEIYTRQRTAKQFSSQLERFRNDQELRGGSDFIDY